MNKDNKNENINGSSKSNINLLRSAIKLYDTYGSCDLIDLGRKYSIISIYTDLKLKEAIYQTYSLYLS